MGSRQPVGPAENEQLRDKKWEKLTEHFCSGPNPGSSRCTLTCFASLVRWFCTGERRAGGETGSGVPLFAGTKQTRAFPGFIGPSFIMALYGTN